MTKLFAHFLLSRAGFDVALPLYVPANLSHPSSSSSVSSDGAASVSSADRPWQLLAFPNLEDSKHLRELRHRNREQLEDIL